MLDSLQTLPSRARSTEGSQGNEKALLKFLKDDGNVWGFGYNMI